MFSEIHRRSSIATVSCRSLVETSVYKCISKSFLIVVVVVIHAAYAKAEWLRFQKHDRREILWMIVERLKVHSCLKNVGVALGDTVTGAHRFIRELSRVWLGMSVTRAL